MKRFFVHVFIVCALAGCGPEKNVRIVGNLTNSGAENIYLHELGSESSRDTVQMNANGHFLFKRKIAQPTFYSLTVNDHAVTLLVHPGERVVISGDARQLPMTYGVTGSEDSHRIFRLYRRLEQTVLLRDSLIRTLQSFEGNRNFVNIQRQFDFLYQNEMDSLRAYNIRFIEQNPQSLTVIYALYQQLDQAHSLFNREEDFYLFRRADSIFYRRFPRVPYVNMLRANVLEMTELYNTLQWSRLLSMLGQDAPEIALPAPNGTVMRLSDLRGKHVLVDFWASWSAACRTGNSSLLEIYNKYRDRGFEIYQVSLDQSREMWERAIEEDGLPWINVSDLKYWNSEIVTLYEVETIPANFLIDREGSITSKNLTIDALDRRLDEIFTVFE